MDNAQSQRVGYVFFHRLSLRLGEAVQAAGRQRHPRKEVDEVGVSALIPY